MREAVFVQCLRLDEGEGWGEWALVEVGGPVVDTGGRREVVIPLR